MNDIADPQRERKMSRVMSKEGYGQAKRGKLILLSPVSVAGLGAYATV